MFDFNSFKAEVDRAPSNVEVNLNNYYAARGYASYNSNTDAVMRAGGFASIAVNCGGYVYKDELIAGSIRGLYNNVSVPVDELRAADEACKAFPQRNFITNFDHVAPDYERLVSIGVPGLREEIRLSRESHAGNADRINYLEALELSLNGFSDMLLSCSHSAKQLGNEPLADICLSLTTKPPQSFREALQLVWLYHVALVLEGRYACALGRLDQYLYSYYERDEKSGVLTREDAVELVCSALYKIGERRWLGGDDVVNIAIGGVKRDGTDAVNELSYVILDAVRRCNIPGPNLSARLHKNAPHHFLDECLKLIGTGLGYPALMNDEVNIPALYRYGYSIEDCRDYCMVGCIENFLPGKQPPWSDGRYNTPKYLEYTLNNGRDMRTGEQCGPQTGEPEQLCTMSDFMAAFEAQLRCGAQKYVDNFNKMNTLPVSENSTQPFLSLLCRDCIGRARDVNGGGTVYPSVHGACTMGIGTVSDSLAAIEQTVYNSKQFSLAELRNILACDYSGYDEQLAILRDVPKYGNNHPLPDKYAVWFLDYQYELFRNHNTRDGGYFYIAAASNTANIPAGAEVCATPDGRRCGEPLSDAASPMHGVDKRGPTAVVNSVTKPDYTKAACGTVLNQKYTPDVFSDDVKRQKLAALIRVYFARGGQEMQINSVSRDVLLDAMKNPVKYAGLVVRVSGFSAYYVRLSHEVQLDILARTEQGAVGAK